MFKLEEIDYHRNGISGEPFCIIKFTHHNSPMLGIVFEKSGYVAVFNRDKLKEDEIRFFYNSFRGDYYEGWLREQVKDYDKKLLEP